MAFRTDPPTIPFEALQWQPTGGEEDPKTRLLAHIKIGDLDMHLEARQVTEDAEGYQTTIDYPEDHDAMCGIADTVFTTTIIDGREYFLFALPYGA